MWQAVTPLIIVACSALAVGALRLLRARLDDLTAAAALIGLATAAGVTAINGVTLLGESVSGPGQVLFLFASMGLLTAPAALCIWLGAVLYIARRRRGWGSAFGVLLAIGGVAFYFATLSWIDHHPFFGIV